MLSTGKVIFAVGIAGMIVSLVILAVCLRILKKSEKNVKESIWREYR